MGFVQDVKWWQWIVIGLMLGSALAFLHMNPDPTGDGQGIGQEEFERTLLARPIEDRGAKYPRMRKILVYPAIPDVQGNPRNAVSFETFDPMPGHPGQFKYVYHTFAASVPYVPLPERTASGKMPKWMSVIEGKKGDTLDGLLRRAYGGSYTPDGQLGVIEANPSLKRKGRPVEPGQKYLIPWNPKENHTVVDYLAAAAADNAWVSYRYAWWTTTDAVWSLWGGGTLVLLGLVLPGMIRLMVGAGLGRERDPDEAYLARFHGGAEPRPAVATGVTAEAEQKLRDLEASLEASLKSGVGADRPAPAPAPAEPAPVKILSAGPLEPATVPAGDPSEEPRDYTGEFYPVVRTTGGKKA